MVYIQVRNSESKECAFQVAQLLDCTSWTGLGPGMMDAVTQGALQANKRVGGFKIFSEGGVWVKSCVHPYLPKETYLTCRYATLSEDPFFFPCHPDKAVVGYKLINYWIRMS